MGKPYQTELQALPSTYEWALKVPVDDLATAIRETVKLPLVAVGSGGSFTVAEYCAGLHRSQAGQVSIAQSPLEAVHSRANAREFAVMLSTASGRNSDILGSFDHLARLEPKSLFLLCMSMSSPVALRAEAFPFVDCLQYSPPVQGDGFLATNSLLAALVLLTRGYSSACGVPIAIPESWALLTGPDTAPRPRPDELWTKEGIVVLFGPETRAAAVDLESKFTESALKNIWIADYRQFAHGRHHWIAKRASTTGVIALVSPNDAAIAEKTLSLLPASVLVYREKIHSTGPLAGLEAIARTIALAGEAGLSVGVDPGRPGVPRFGSQIYRLRAFSNGRPRRNAEDLAILRKLGTDGRDDQGEEELDSWRDSYRAFILELRRASFRGVVLDYDGTLCTKSRRYEPLSVEVAGELRRLLEGGLLLGVATGRGKSVRSQLQKAIPEALWNDVLVGYYSGGDLGLLSDNESPVGAAEASEHLEELAQDLISSTLLGELAKIDIRRPQITVQSRVASKSDFVWGLVQEIAHRRGTPSATLVRSDHSVDILAPGVDKRQVARRLLEMIGEPGAAILCIGDRGRYPGNDHLLLSAKYGLSVDEPTLERATGWNIAPIGHRGESACVAYLRSLRASRGRARFVVAGEGNSR